MNAKRVSVLQTVHRVGCIKRMESVLSLLSIEVSIVFFLLNYKCTLMVQERFCGHCHVTVSKHVRNALWWNNCF